MNNSICKFEDIFKNLPKKKIDIISACLFKLDNGYRDFSKYIEGGKNVKKLADKLNMYFVLFIDDSIYNNKEIYDKLINNIYDKKTIIIKYDCPKFKNDNGYHKGLFGTLVRFFPLFDFPNNPFKKIMICDMDYKYKNNIDPLCTNYNLLKQTKGEFVFNIYSTLPEDVGKDFIYLTVPFRNIKEHFGFLAGSFCCNLKKKFDHNIIINYINTLMDKSSDLYKTMYSLTQHHEIDDTFTYGVDEYFFNNILYYHMKKLNYTIYTINDYNLLSFILSLKFKYNITENEIFKKEYLHFLQYVLKQPKNTNINQLFSIIYKILSSYELNVVNEPKKFITDINYGATSKQLNVSKSIYNYFINLEKNKNYKLIDKITLQFILKYKYIIKCLEVSKNNGPKYKLYNYYMPSEKK